MCVTCLTFSCVCMYVCACVYIQYGKDYFYRAHPDDLKAFYAAAESFHRAYDALTEFDSLSGLAFELLPGGSRD